MAYIEDMLSFYERFRMWRVIGLDLLFRYMLLIDKSDSMTDTLSLAEERSIFDEESPEGPGAAGAAPRRSRLDAAVRCARDFVEDVHTMDDRGIEGQITFFGTSLCELAGFSRKQSVVREARAGSCSCGGGTRLWDSVCDCLDVLSEGLDPYRHQADLLVFTDGVDTASELGIHVDTAMRFNKVGFDKVVATLGRLRDEGRVLPNVSLVACVTEDDPASRDLRAIWRTLERRAPRACEGLRQQHLLDVKWLDSFKGLLGLFHEKAEQIKNRIFDICSFENFAAIYDKQLKLPPTRFVFYPALCLARYLHETKERSSSVSRQGLHEHLVRVVDDIADDEATKQYGLHQFGERQRGGHAYSQDQKKKYEELWSEPGVRGRYATVMIHCMETYGWFDTTKDDPETLRLAFRAGSTAEKVMQEYWLTDKWEDLTDPLPKDKDGRKIIGPIVKKALQGVDVVSLEWIRDYVKGESA